MLKLCSSVLWGSAGAAPVGGGSSGTTGWVSEPQHGPGPACKGETPEGWGRAGSLRCVSLPPCVALWK